MRVALPAQRSISPLACAGARFDPFPRARVLLTACLFALIGSPGAVGLARAQDDAAPRQEGREADNQVIVLAPLHVEAEAPRTIGGKAPDGPCVIVDIAGERAGHLDCATRALQDAARTAQSEARAGIDAPLIGAGSPDVQTGVAHEAATRLRMGNALGRSVHPERPASRPPRGPRP
ncbi:hypothetical protein [Brevundimonas diminuta]|uniref:hypothetical protein n=1 Tax=Brevundimonas diminuta TaxID=293 RepID=UPI0030FAA7CA